MTQASGTQQRRSCRSNVMLQAALVTSDASLAVILRNLSADGALVRGGDLPDEGARVLFHRQGLSVPGRIAWVQGEYAGVSFDSPLFPREMLRHIPAIETKPPPEIKRRPGLAARPLTQSERIVVERWAAVSLHTLGD